MKLKMYNNNKKISIGKYEINVYTDWDWCRFYIGCLFHRGVVLCIGFFLIHVDICDTYKAFAQEKETEDLIKKEQQ